MKFLKSLCLIICLVMLCSCVSQREMNIGEFIKKVNSEAEILPSSDTFDVYRDGELYRYSKLLNEHLLLCIYSDTDGTAARITLTSEKPDRQYADLRPVLLSAFTGKTADECKKIISEAENAVNISKDIYTIAIIKVGEAETFLISYSDDIINANGCPTLKRHINEKDISRPTIGTQKALTEK